MNRLSYFILVCFLLFFTTLTYCSDTNKDHITVQHVLIGFSGSIPGKPIQRSFEEAKNLANEVFTMANEDRDFTELVAEYTDDSVPGIYKMSNTNVPPNQGEFPREQMVQGFGDVAFSLAIDEVGMAEYNEQTSPYGWHIIKRLE